MIKLLVTGGAGFIGSNFIYYLLENIALTYTMAANVSVIVSTAPIFTVLFCNMLYKDEKRTGVKFWI